MSIEKFIELSKIITKHRLKKIDMLSRHEEKKGNIYLKIAFSLSNGTVASLDEMAGMSDMEEGSNRFHVFKMRFFDKLLNSLLFLDLDSRKSTPYTKAIVYCNRNIHCIRLLLILSARNAAIELALKTLKKALDFELSDIVVFCARYLRTHYSIVGDLTLFRYYNELLKKHQKIIEAEDAITEYFESINVTVVNSNVLNTEIMSSLDLIFQEATEIWHECPTYQVNLQFYRIKGLVEFLSHQYEAALQTWEAFDSFISTYDKFEYESRKGECELKKMDCYMHMRDFKNGLICAEICNSLFKPHSNNWFIFKEYFLILCFHTKNFNQGADTIDAITRDEHFKVTTGNRQEKWKIFDAYLYVLVKSGRVKASRRNLSKLKINKFLNETPTYSKDKRGYNISILLIQILYILLEKNFEILSDKFASLQRYVYRYLDNQKDYRTQLFLKMVLEIDKGDYQVSKIKPKVAALHDELKRTQFSYVSGLEGLEIIPFTELWEIMIECLEP